MFNYSSRHGAHRRLKVQLLTLTLALDGSERSASHPGCFTLGEVTFRTEYRCGFLRKKFIAPIGNRSTIPRPSVGYKNLIGRISCLLTRKLKKKFEILFYSLVGTMVVTANRFTIYRMQWLVYTSFLASDSEKFTILDRFYSLSSYVTGLWLSSVQQTTQPVISLVKQLAH